MNSEIFLIDANSFITPYKLFYSCELAPRFWSQMGIHIKSGRIAILDVVKDEIYTNKDALSDWLDTVGISKIIDRRKQPIISRYSEVLHHVQENPCYKDTALNEWAKKSVADAWLIAAASVYNYTIITFETPNKGLNANSQSKRAKIPDAAGCFGVKIQNLYYMMKQLNIKL